jgi:oligopeptide/dipeptide ABC transporter ATP-binding protein
MSAVLLESRNLVKHFQVGPGKILHAVDGIDLPIHEKEIVGLVGESGSGKSTYGKTLLGIHDKTSGEVYYRGEKLPQKYNSQDFARTSKQMQMIFQDPYSSLNPRMTVKDIVGEGLLLQGQTKRSAINDRVAEWLGKVGLSADHLSRYPHEFSGGQRQRIGIARAMIVSPQFVVCDEPISALDVSIQAQIINLLDQLKREMGLTLLFIAHDLSMVRYVSDRTAVMYLGAMVELGKSDEVYFNPKHPYAQMLIESNPEADPKKERTREHFFIKGEIPSPINLKKGCRFAGRCPKVMDHCRTVDPQWKEVAPAHFAACHLY